MTLVAARRVGGAIAIAADWRLTYEHKRPSYQNGALKVIIVHPNVACAYAGTVSDALSAIRANGEIDRSLAPEDFLPDFVARLLEASRDGKSDYHRRAEHCPVR